jgi:hypothetical protein
VGAFALGTCCNRLCVLVSGAGFGAFKQRVGFGGVECLVPTRATSVVLLSMTVRALRSPWPIRREARRGLSRSGVRANPHRPLGEGSLEGHSHRRAR